MVSHKHLEAYEKEMQRKKKEEYDLNKTKFHELDEIELHKCADKSREIEDLEERLDTGVKILVGYQKSPWKGHTYRQRARDIDHDDLKELEDKVNKQIYKKRGTLNHNEQMEFFKDLANVVGPPLYIGNEDTPEDNWKHLELYLRSVQTGEKGEKKTAFEDVLSALERGDVMGAKQIIVDTIVSYNINKDASLLMEKLVPPDQDYWLEIAEPLADRYNKELKRSGRGHKAVSPLALAKDYETIRGAFTELGTLALGHEKHAAKKKYIKDIKEPEVTYGKYKKAA